MTATPPNTGLGIAACGAVLSGFAVWVNGYAVRRFPDATVYTTAKNATAGVILLAAFVALSGSTVAVSSRKTPSRQTPLGTRSRWGFLLIAVVGGSLPFVLFFEGLQQATATDAAFLHKTLVVWVAVLAGIVLRERIGLFHVGAVALLVAGHLLLAGGFRPTEFGRGESMILLATLLWSVEVVLAKRLLPETSAMTLAVARMLGGAVLLLVWLAATGDLGQLWLLETSQWAWALLTGSSLAAFVMCWYSALAKARAVDVTAVLVFGAVITGLLQASTGQRNLWELADGYALISFGVAIVVWRSLRSAALESAERRVVQ